MNRPQRGLPYVPGPQRGLRHDNGPSGAFLKPPPMGVEPHWGFPLLPLLIPHPEFYPPGRAFILGFRRRSDRPHRSMNGALKNGRFRFSGPAISVVGPKQTIGEPLMLRLHYLASQLSHGNHFPIMYSKY